VRREAIDRLWQFSAEPLYKLVPRHPDLAGKRIERVVARGFFNIARRNGLVRPIADPRLCRTAEAILLEALEQLAEPAADDVPSGAAGECAS
jgi:hypothetical protein